MTLLLLGGCGDACEKLCRETSHRVDACRDAGTTWADLGARSRVDFVSQCQDGWSRTSADLSTSDLGEAVQICREGKVTLEAMTCDELRLVFTSR